MNIASYNNTMEIYFWKHAQKSQIYSNPIQSQFF